MRDDKKKHIVSCLVILRVYEFRLYNLFKSVSDTQQRTIDLTKCCVTDIQDYTRLHSDYKTLILISYEIISSGIS